MSVLGQKLLGVLDTLRAAALPHAFGGAIALAYCTSDPRGTSDLDINVFVGGERARDVLDAMPADVQFDESAATELTVQGQTRIWWGDTPLALFLNVADSHRDVAAHARRVPFEGREIPVLTCRALAVFKAMFDRPKDWVDIAGMVSAGAIEVEVLRADLRAILGDDSRIDRLAQFSPPDERG